MILSRAETLIASPVLSVTSVPANAAERLDGERLWLLRAFNSSYRLWIMSKCLNRSSRMLTGIVTFVIPVNSAICFDISSDIDEVAGSTETLVEKSRCDDFDRGALVTATRLVESSSSWVTIDKSSTSVAARETLAGSESAVCSVRFAMRCASPSDVVCATGSSVVFPVACKCVSGAWNVAISLTGSSSSSISLHSCAFVCASAIFASDSDPSSISETVTGAESLLRLRVERHTVAGVEVPSGA